jgi:hypothetical protein
MCCIDLWIKKQHDQPAKKIAALTGTKIEAISEGV